MKNRIATTALCATLAALPALAQDAPVAGEVAEGSLAGKTLTFVSYGGIYQDGQVASLQDFIQKSGVELLSDGPTEIAKLQAQVESKNVLWDVVDTGDIYPYVHCGTLFQKLDMSKIDTSHLPAGQVSDCSVPAMNYGVVINYRRDAFADNPPSKQADFFDTQTFPGLRAVEGTPTPSVYLLEMAARTLGKQPADLTVEDIDPAFDVLRKMRDEGNLIFWTTGAESQQMMESGEAEFIHAWTGRAMSAVKNGAEYDQVWDGWVVTMDQLTIPMGVKDPDAAHALINAAIGKRAQEILTETTSYAPINDQAAPKVDEIVQAFLTNTPERQAQGHIQNLPFWVANYDAVSQKWADFLAGS